MLKLSFVLSHRYKLQFLVSDVVQKQKNVEANVTVKVSTISVQPLVSYAVPLLIVSHNPRQLIMEDKVNQLINL